MKRKPKVSRKLRFNYRETTRKNGKIISRETGEIEVDVNNILNAMKKGALVVAIGGVLLSGTISFASGKIEEHNERQEVMAQQIYNQELERVTNKKETYTIEYEVGFGQTISGIVYSYQSDPNIAQQIIAEVPGRNNLDYASLMQGGKTYFFHGVPEDALMDEEFCSRVGQTVNYDFLQPEREIQINLNFITNYVNNNRIKPEQLEEAQNAVDEKTFYINSALEYIKSLPEEERQQQYEELREQTRKSCLDLEERFSYVLEATVDMDGKNYTVPVGIVGKYKPELQTLTETERQLLSQRVEENTNTK